MDNVFQGMRILGFEMRLGKDPKTGAKTKQVPWVKLTTVGRGNTSVTEYMVERLRPDTSTMGDWDDDYDSEKRNYMSAKWAWIEKAYEAWLKGMEVPEDGTPLMSWALLNASEVKIFQNNGIRTVEELANLPAGVMSKLTMPGIHQKQQQARIYLESVENAEIVNRVAETEAANEDLRAQLAEAMSQIKALQGIMPAQPVQAEEPDEIPEGSVPVGKKLVDEEGDEIPEGAIPKVPLEELPDDLSELEKVEEPKAPAPRKTRRRS